MPFNHKDGAGSRHTSAVRRLSPFSTQQTSGLRLLPLFDIIYPNKMV